MLQIQVSHSTETICLYIILITLMVMLEGRYTQRRRLKFREAKKLTGGHTAGQ